MINVVVELTNIILSSFVAQEQKESRSSRVFDRQMSFSSLPRKSASISPSPEKAPDKLYEFQAGTFDPLSSTKTRKSANLVASKSSLRKSTMHQFNGIARKWDACFEKPDVQQRSHAVCYTPEEVPSGFSFRPANIETLGNPGIRLHPCHISFYVVTFQILVTIIRNKSFSTKHSLGILREYILKN